MSRTYRSGKVVAAVALAGVLAACTGTDGANPPEPSPFEAGSASASASSMPSSLASTAAGSETKCALLPEDAGWYGDNRDKINAMLQSVGTCGGEGDVAKGAPLALFDWDNTIVKNDIGDATTFWMLANGKIRQPEYWKSVSSYLTDDGEQALQQACSNLAPVGEPLPTHEPQGAKCADEILSVYTDGETTTDLDAFSGFDARRIEPQYAFAAQLLHGYTDAEVQDFARQAREENLAAPEGHKQRIGTQDVTGWVREYSQMTDLITALKANGFDVRIVSASAEPVVRVWAEPLGLTGNKVMGVKVKHDGDVRGVHLESCGGDESSMTYIEGKRCRVNEEVFGITGPDAFKPAPLDKRAAFGAGDSDTDVSFMMDATALRLAINRNKTELMCHAYDNEDGKWIVNPMFIDPNDKKDEKYECSTEGEILSNGEEGPLKDSAGNVIEDQEDTVFGKP
ncbi:haloacid dehalogenase-like hydrolase [Stomatohabitans albus]|uniref:haloacid dehalogenase-like hydrolase n=1 Tax=Stomatohabitans albus TaxID=3110766 RepID=UPI00300D08E8